MCLCPELDFLIRSPVFTKILMNVMKQNTYAALKTSVERHQNDIKNSLQITTAVIITGKLKAINTQAG